MKYLTLGSEIQNALEGRRLPPIYADQLSPAEIADIRAKQKQLIQDIEYGAYPADLMEVSGKVCEEETIFDGKAILRRVELTLTGKRGAYTFPVSVMLPLRSTPVASFVFISFSELSKTSDLPLQEMCERGYALFSFACGSITSDEDRFDDGLLPYFADQVAIADHKVGKMAIWAYAASRVLDYALTLPEIDPAKIAVVGHSRLGKTAVLAGVMDERFALTIANDSGCSGAALHRGKNGERIFNITDKFSRWFTKEFTLWQNREDELPFDQHTVLGLVAPRLLYVCSATNDGWADPVSEFLGAAAASEAYAAVGKTGLVADAFPQPEAPLHEGNIGYHLRSGGHSLAPYDWYCFMDYMDKHF